MYAQPPPTRTHPRTPAGSSREFSGWGDAAPSRDIVAAILGRAASFLPLLPTDPDAPGMGVRVGLRPYAVRGLPAIGPVEECEGG